MNDSINRKEQGAPLVFDHVSVRYAGGTQRALDNVSVTAEPGKMTAVVGPNGSGKSTLVRTLLRRVPMESGRVTVGSADVASLDARERARRIAIVPQREEPVLPLRVEEFVGLGRHARRSAFGGLSADDHAAVESAVTRAGIGDALKRRTDTLSGGEWQRVRIARALAQCAPVLVLDEPTTFLDIAHEMAVFELLDELAQKGQTVLLVSHQLNLVARFASHIVLLHRGTVAAAGDAAAVMRGEILERVYEWPLVVTRDPAVGAPALLPLRGRGRHRERPSL
ncbi:ABC transporter ATP-binding protein [Gemmatimonas sp.]|uniref:ABC transporter ATP-binding protein n=1 Tax=Gemmatimonas sp. TaxID=1962908 RepID=UPI00286C53CC|nr:ABC transporter ATP-binding protein [Gemmatimonas sp.]